MSALKVHAIREPFPAAKWQRRFRACWPDYRRWFRQRDDRGPSLETARDALERHMPELVPVYERLLVLAQADEEIARFLTLYDPAPYIRGCSQVAWTDGEPVLIRNYDYDPRLWDRVILASAWRGRWVIAMSDCGWGALDGMNEAGLVVSLAFGGRPDVGHGFGSPLIVRYVLERCETVAEAREVLAETPTHMAYNITALDLGGDYLTASLSPDRPPDIRRRRFATNHQEGGEWTAYERRTGTRQREAFLERTLDDPGLTGEDLARRFLEPPLFGADYRHGQGTLYTAVYRPARRLVEYRWRSRWMVQSIDAFSERTEIIPIRSRSWPIRSSR